MVLFLVLMTGFFIRKKDILDDHGVKKMTTLVIRVTAPLLMIDAMAQPSTMNFKTIGQILLLSLFVYGFLFVMSMLVPIVLRVPKENIGIYKFMTMFSNVAFMGFPVVSSIYGKEAIFITSIYNLPFYLLVFTLGIYFVSMNHQKTSGFNWRLMLNPGVYAVAIGLVIFGLKLQLPTVIGQSIAMIGGLTTPLSMLVIGASLVHVDFKGLLRNKRIYIHCLLKQIVFPALVLLVLLPFPLEGAMLGVPVIIVGMPVAANAVMLAKEYGGDDIIASEGVFVSTFLSLGSIVFLSYLLSLVG